MHLHHARRASVFQPSRKSRTFASGVQDALVVQVAPSVGRQIVVAHDALSAIIQTPIRILEETTVQRRTEKCTRAEDRQTKGEAASGYGRTVQAQKRPLLLRSVCRPTFSANHTHCDRTRRRVVLVRTPLPSHSVPAHQGDVKRTSSVAPRRTRLARSATSTSRSVSIRQAIQIDIVR